MRARRVTVFAAPVVAALMLVGCASTGGSPSGGAGGARAGSSASGASPSAATELGAAGTGWFAGNSIEVVASAYDPASDVVTVRTRVVNTATEDSLEPDAVDHLFLDTGQGAPVAANRLSSVAVAGATTDIDIEFALGGGAAPDLRSAVLVLGGRGEATWTVPLDGSDAEGTEPWDVDAGGVADAGGLLFTVARAQVLPWACEDADDLGPGGSGRVWYEPGADDEAAVVVWGDIVETQSIVGGDTPLAASLTGPDGVTAPQIGTVNSVFDVNEGIRDFPLCFTVPSPVAGAYTLTWNSYREASAQLVIDIP